MTAGWRDITSYSQGDTVREPRTWEFELTPDVYICVTKGHHAYLDQWVMHCDPWFDTHLLPAATTAHEAQQIAIRKMYARLKMAYEAIEIWEGRT